MPVTQSSMRTMATASTTSLPTVPNSSPLCSSHTVRKAEIFPSYPLGVLMVMRLKSLYGGNDMYTWLRLVTSMVSPCMVRSDSRSSPSV